MKFLKFILWASAVIGFLYAFFAYALVPFNSQQEGTNPVNGYFLQTNGATSTWAVVTQGPGGGGTTTINGVTSSTFLVIAGTGITSTQSGATTTFILNIGAGSGSSCSAGNAVTIISATGTVTCATFITSGAATTTLAVGSSSATNGPSFTFSTSTAANVWNITGNGTQIIWTIPPKNDQYFAPSTTIATNNNQLTNGSGYITTSSITIGGVASNTFQLGNDLVISSTGTIGFVNNTGYITTITIGGTASTTFNLGSNDLVISSTGTIQFASHNISQFTNNSGYITTSTWVINSSGTIVQIVNQGGSSTIGVSQYLSNYTNNAGFLTTSTWVVNASGTNIITYNQGGSSTVAIRSDPTFGSITDSGVTNALDLGGSGGLITSFGGSTCGSGFSYTISATGTLGCAATSTDVVYLASTTPWSSSPQGLVYAVGGGTVSASSSAVFTANGAISSTQSLFTSSTIAGLNFINATGTALTLTGLSSFASTTHSGYLTAGTTTIPANNIFYVGSTTILFGVSNTSTHVFSGNIFDPSGNAYVTSTSAGAGTLNTSSPWVANGLVYTITANGQALNSSSSFAIVGSAISSSIISASTTFTGITNTLLATNGAGNLVATSTPVTTSTLTYSFDLADAAFPNTNFPQFNLASGTSWVNTVLDFNSTTTNYAYWNKRLPNSIKSVASATLDIVWQSPATTGTAVFETDYRCSSSTATVDATTQPSLRHVTSTVQSSTAANIYENSYIALTTSDFTTSGATACQFKITMDTATASIRQDVNVSSILLELYNTVFN